MPPRIVLLAVIAACLETVAGWMPHVSISNKKTCTREETLRWNSLTLMVSSRPSENDYEIDGDDDDDEDDDEPPSVNLEDWSPPKTMSYGLNSGRSSPSQRKALGTSGSSTARIHICTNCGSEFVKWMGRCSTCKEWNTIQEHVVRRESTPNAARRPVFGSGGSTASRQPSWLDGVEFSAGDAPIRITDLCYDMDGKNTGQKKKNRIVVPEDEELNNVLGGGIMPGSLILVGGDPGVGKSTLLLQAAGAIASLATPTPGIGMGLPEGGAEDAGLGPVWYVSGEENPDQIASRAERLGIIQSELFLSSETHADTLCAQIASYLTPHQPLHSIDNSAENGDSKSSIRQKPPSVVIIDSIQTMVCDAGGMSSSGGVTQVRESVALFLRLAKSSGIPVILVGHVTKSGDVAGPRTVEHMVDCVLYLEGGTESHGSMNIRVLRASKNRFGSSDEVGVYEMTSGRLMPVSDPSSLFLAHRVTEHDAEGCAIAIALEGRRAMTVEVQALVTPVGGNAGFGRRTVDGIANSRLLLLMGVLQKRSNMFFQRQDVYVNVVGRMRLDRGEGNTADLAIAVALVSSLRSIAVRADTAFVGEVGLLGELRPVTALEKRLREARRMGFSRVITPRSNTKRSTKGYSNKQISKSIFDGIEWIQCATLRDAIDEGLVIPVPKRVTRKKKKGESGMPETLQDLGLDDIIDDEDDEDDAFL